MTFPELLEELRIPFVTEGHHHVRSGWIGTDCPRCSMGWEHYRLGINTAFGYASCWQCGPLPLVQCLIELSGQPYGKVKDLLDQLDVSPQRRLERAPSPGLKLPAEVGPLLPAHVRYLRRRGLNPEEMTRLWGVKGIGIAPRLQWRLFIPVADARGRTVSWTTRGIVDTGRRYINARPTEESAPIKSLLYGGHLAGHAAMVVEGPVDAWRVGPGAVATFGTMITQAQVDAIAKYPVRIIALDSEPAAQRAARKLCEKLNKRPGVTLNCVLRRSKDAGEAGEREIAQLRRMLR